MPISVQCPQGHSFRAKDELAGKRVRCPTCHTIIAVPAGELAPTLDWIADDAEEKLPVALPSRGTTNSPHGARPASQNRWLIPSVGGGVVALLVVVVIVFFSRSRGRYDAAPSMPAAESTATAASPPSPTTSPKPSGADTGSAVPLSSPPARAPEATASKLDAPPANETPAAVAAAVPIVRLKPDDPEPADKLRREDIPIDELAEAGGGDPARAPAELVAILGDSRLRHWGTVSAVEFHPNGKLLATGGSEGVVRLWNSETGRALRTLRDPHMGRVEDITLSPDGKWLASVSEYLHVDGPDDVGEELIFWDAILWNIETGQRHRVLKRQREPAFSPNLRLYAVAFTPDGKQLVSGGHNFFSQPSAAAPSPASRPKATRPTTPQPAAARGIATLFDTQPGRQSHVLEIKEGSVVQLGFVNDGQQVVTASVSQTEKMPQGTIRLWDAKSGRLLRSLDSTNAPQNLRISLLATNPRLPMLAMGTGTEIQGWPGGPGWLSGIALWNTQSWKADKNIESNSHKELAGQMLTLVAFDRSGHTLAVGTHGGKLFLAESKTGDVRLTGVRQPKGISFGWWYGGAMSAAMKLSDDGRQIAFRTSHRAVLCDIDPPQTRFESESGPTDFSAAAFSLDGATLTMASRQGVQLVNVETRQLRQTLVPDGGLPVAASQCLQSDDGSAIAVRTELDGTSGIAIHDTATGQRRTFIPDPSNVVQSQKLDAEGKLVSAPSRQTFVFSRAALSPDGNLFATDEPGPADKASGAIALWDTHTGAKLRTIEALASKKFSYRQFARLAFSPDGRWLVAESTDSFVLIDVASGTIRHTLIQNVTNTRFVPPQSYETPAASPFAFTPDSKTLVTTGVDFRAADKQEWLLWDVETGRHTATLDPPKRFDRQQGTSALTISPDGQRLAVAGFTGQVLLWDLTDRRLIRTLTLGPPLGTISQVLFSPTGRHLLTVNGNGTVYLVRLSPSPGSD